MIRLLKKSQQMRRLVFRTYDEKVINYFENPPNVGTLDRNAKNVGTCNFILFYECISNA
jgi:hypothetical protein